MRPATRRLLSVVADRYPSIVVSGRARPDARRWVRGIRLEEVVGNHGIEPLQPTGRMREEVLRWTPLLTQRLSSFKGVSIENKTFSLAVHYRLSREKKKALGAILEAARELGPHRVIAGKQVVNLLPAGAPHKGIAVERERDRLKCDTSIYVGDDETDEDVFAIDAPGRLLSIRVGPRRASHAAYYLRNQAAIDDFLEELLRLRPAREMALSGYP
jgi:trehalose 6-phosphate phosphatase